LLLPFCERALAAAVLEAELVRPSLRTLLAADAALLLVCFVFLAMRFVLAQYVDEVKGPPVLSER
jgi:hypothetical protein